MPTAALRASFRKKCCSDFDRGCSWLAGATRPATRVSAATAVCSKPGCSLAGSDLPLAAGCRSPRSPPRPSALGCASAAGPSAGRLISKSSAFAVGPFGQRSSGSSCLQCQSALDRLFGSPEPRWSSITGT